MKAEQFSRNVLALDPNNIRFAGIMERSGHLYASATKNGTEEYLKGRNPEISLAQSVYIVDLRKMFTQELGNLNAVAYSYDKVKLINIPVKEHVLVISTEPKVNTDQIVEKVAKYIKSVESELSLYPPSNIINEEKKEALRNLHQSGISEELIAEQLDLDVNTVKMLIAEMK
ncbi:MAG TPA: DUF6659 family protein [Nitrososphaera sp.]|jgi:hypothetical protein